MKKRLFFTLAVALVFLLTGFGTALAVKPPGSTDGQNQPGSTGGQNQSGSTAGQSRTNSGSSWLPHWARNLPPQTQQALQQIYQTRIKTIYPLVMQRRAAQAQLMAELAQENIDRQSVDQTIQKITDLQGRIIRENVNLMQQIKQQYPDLLINGFMMGHGMSWMGSGLGMGCGLGLSDDFDGYKMGQGGGMMGGGMHDDGEMGPMGGMMGHGGSGHGMGGYGDR